MIENEAEGATGKDFVAKTPEEAQRELLGESGMSKSDVLSHPRFVEHTEPSKAAENTETLKRFATGLRELQAANPEIVGASLFGSRLKGEATAKSDVDSTILVNAEALKAQGIDITVEPDGKLKWSDPNLQGELRKHFGTFLAQKTDKDPANIEGGVYVQPISQELIRSQLETTLSYYDRLDDWRAAIDKWHKDLEDDSPQPKMPDYPPVSGGISALFAPELLQDYKLDEYRRAVIDTLSRSAHGEEIWRDDILSSVKFGEGHFENDDKAYPRTIAEARAYWNLG